MAHALRRISYATCDATHKQVAFMAREPSGAANMQYCHVFVTESPSGAEELNRLIGNAFKFAYVRQRLIKLHQSGERAFSTAVHIPQLSDCHPIWLPKPEEISNSLSLFTTLKIPPPPDFPPPVSIESETTTDKRTNLSSAIHHTACNDAFTNANITTSTLRHDSSESSAVNMYKNDAVKRESLLLGVENPTTPFLSDNDPSQLSVHSDSVLIGDQQGINSNDDQANKNTSELEKKLHRISTPQAIDLAFLRRHFLRRSEGKGSENSKNVRGGSARQPRLRQGSTLSNLLSSARHSSFFPSSSSYVIDNTNIPPKTSKSQETSNVSDILSSPTPIRRPPIFVDLRTFAGGSPVVALKERLDAQAIADAKASAFAEAAAVLAAAKQVSSRSSAAVQPVTNSTSKEVDQLPRPTACYFANRTSKSSPSGNSSSVEITDLSPPIPPVRMHSLRRNHEQSNSKNFSPHLPLSSPVPEDLSNEFDKDEDREIVESIEAVMKAASYDSNSPKESKSSKHQDLSYRDTILVNDSSNIPIHSSNFKHQHIDNFRVAQPIIYKQAQKNTSSQFDRKTHCSCENSYLGNVVSQSQAKYPFEQLLELNRNDIQQANRHSFPSNIDFTSSSLHAPLHILADPAIQDTHKKQVFSSIVSNNLHITPVPGSVMSMSSLSTETPTPTATPTPTPEQTAQSQGFNNNRNDDDNVLNQAPWYQALLPREIAFELLAREEVGSFLVRNSATHPGCCALSVRVPNKDNPLGITHYLIQKTSQGVRLKGLDKEWPSLQALVTHLTVIPEMLPCPLKLSQYTANPIFTQFDLQLTNDPSKEITGQQRNYNIRLSRTEVGDNNRITNSNLSSHHSQHILHSAVDLSCRPIPPSCATISHISPSNSPNQYLSSHNVVGQDPFVLGSYHVSKSSQLEPGVSNWLINETNDDSNQLPTNEPTKSSTQTSVKLDYIRWKQNSIDLTNISQPEYIDGQHLTSKDSSNTNRKLSYTSYDLSENNTCVTLDYAEEDEDYQRLSDFSSILADLNLANERPLTSC
ncbi:Tensin-4 [Schistosoma japonicum]|nr:Tensin-4 [Schistosoma japonicum]